MTKAATRPPALVATLVAFVVLALAGCGGEAQSPPPASPGGGGFVSTDQIALQNFTITPSTVMVSEGTKVTWTNKDTTAHDVTSTDGPGVDAATTSTFRSGVLAQGDKFAYTFRQRGTYYYECAIHASMPPMHAVVIVK